MNISKTSMKTSSRRCVTLSNLHCMEISDACMCVCMYVCVCVYVCMCVREDDTRHLCQSLIDSVFLRMHLATDTYTFVCMYVHIWNNVCMQLSSHGEVDMMAVCDNTADHMTGNVYVKFRTERGAEAAFNAMRTKFYDGRPVCPEYSPVTDFREASCRQYEEENCSRGGNCNFMHVKHASRLLEARLFTRQKKTYQAIRDRERDRDYRRGRSRSRSRSRERSPSRENSEERRARIASWNKSRKEQRQEEDKEEE